MRGGLLGGVPGGGLHPLDGGRRDGEPVEVRNAAAAQRALQGEAFEHVAQAEQLVDVARRQRHYAHAAARQVLDQPLLPQQAQRLPQRGAADPEPAGELLLHQSLARREGAADDLGPQPADGQLDQARGVQARLQLSRHGSPSPVRVPA